MVSTSIPMTVIGRQKLLDELKNLKTIERPKVIAAIEEARAHGDLKENAEYHAAKEKQGFIEGRIAEIGSKLAGAQVIDPTQIKSDKITFGAFVTVIEIETEVEKTYQIVGDDEADLKKGKIGIQAPIARAMLGKAAGDTFSFNTPNGKKEFEVINFCYK